MSCRLLEAQWRKPQILGHGDARWNFFALASLRSVPTLWAGPRFLLRYGLSKKGVPSLHTPLGCNQSRVLWPRIIYLCVSFTLNVIPFSGSQRFQSNFSTGMGIRVLAINFQKEPSQIFSFPDQASIIGFLKVRST